MCLIKYYFVRTHHTKLYKATKKLNPEKYALMIERTNLPNSKQTKGTTHSVQSYETYVNSRCKHT